MELIISLINNDEFRIPGEYYAKPLNNTDLSWMKDEEGYKKTAEEAGSDYMKGKNDNELNIIKNFIAKINNGTINNKNKAGNEFRKLKQKVTNDILRQDLIKYLEKYLFGEDIGSKEKYEESIAERVKTRRNTQKTFAPSSPPKEDYSAETDEYLKYLEEQEKGRVRLMEVYKKKIHGSGVKLIIEEEDMNDIIKIIEALENSGILLKGVTKTIDNETKEQRGGFLGMLLRTLGASLLGNLLTGGKGIMRVGDGIVCAGDGIVRAGEGSIASRAKGEGSKKNPKFTVTFSSINKCRNK